MSKSVKTNRRSHEWDQAINLTKKAHGVFDAIQNRPQTDARLEDIRKLLSDINLKHVSTARSAGLMGAGQGWRGKAGKV